MKLKALLITAIAVMLALPASAVTDKEMEEAKAITAKAYLRYVNDGSGYLDDITVKSMSELNSKLKAKEKENIQAFNSVKVPQDYASWDKAKLVEFWAVTFFTSPSLDSKGKGAKPRVRKQIEAMNVSAPSKPEKPAAETENKTAEPEVQTQAEQAAETQPLDGQIPPEELDAQQQRDVLADQKNMEQDAAESEEEVPEQQSHTWVYVLVLAILVAVVIWLVVYAANLMKRQPGEDDEPRRDNTRRAPAEPESDKELRAQTRKAIATKNDELQAIHERLQAEESRNADLSMELEREKRDRFRLEERISQLREENNRLLEKLQASERAATRTRTAPAPAVNDRYAEPAEEKRPPRRKAEETPSEAPERRRVVEEAPRKQPLLKVIYLGRANRRGIFVRADRRMNPGNTIYRLDTNDGLVGTFHVVDEPDVVELALNDPIEYLSNGCTGEDLEDTTGVGRIATVSAGTAIFENGYWKVLRKSRIRYE